VKKKKEKKKKEVPPKEKKGKKGPKSKGGGDFGLSTPEFSAQDRAELQIRLTNLETKLTRSHSEVQQLQGQVTRLNARVREVQDSEEACREISERDADKRMQMLEIERSTVTQLMQQIDALKAQHHEAMSAAMKAADQDRTELEERLVTIQVSYNELAHFRDQKEKLMRDMEVVEEALKTEKMEREKEVEKMRKAANDERRKTRDAMILKLRQTRDELFQLTDEHRNLKAQQTVRENERLLRDVTKYEKEVSFLMERNNELSAEVGTLSHHLSVDRDTNAHLVRRTHAQDKMVGVLSDKLRALEAEGEERRSALDTERQRKIAALSETVDKQYDIILELKQELDVVTARSQETSSALQALRRERAMERDEASHLQSFLVACLSDVKRLQGAVSSSSTFGATGGSAAVRLDSLDSSDRMEILNYLLRKLNLWQSGLHPSAPQILTTSTGLGGKGNSSQSGHLAPRVPEGQPGPTKPRRNNPMPDPDP